MPTFRSTPLCDAPALNPRILILAKQALNQASALAMMVDTYVTLERIITNQPIERGKAPERADLGALMRGLNGELGRQIDTLVRHTGALHEVAISEAGLR